MLIYYTNAILQFNTRSAYNSLHASSFSIPVSWDSIPAPKPNPRQAQIPGLLSARAKGCVLQIMRNISLGIYNESAVSIGQDTIPPPKPIPDRQQIPPRVRNPGCWQVYIGIQLKQINPLFNYTR
jgi:hypothetical protein